MIIRIQSHKHILYRGLQRQRPYHTRHSTGYIIGIKYRIRTYNRLHHIQWRCTYIAEYDSDCSKKPDKTNPFQ